MIKTVNSEVINTSNTDMNSMSTEYVSSTREDYGLAVKEKFEAEIKKSGEVDKLTSSIDISNTSTIIEFGKEPAESMAKISDQVLSKYNSTSVNEVSKLVDSLLNIMKKIDIGEIKSLSELSAEKAKKGIFGRFKETAQQKLDKLVSKYRTIGSEMETVCNQLAVYEKQIKDSNIDISNMYNAAKEEYRKLVAVVMAGEQACKEIEEYRDGIQTEISGLSNGTGEAVNDTDTEKAASLSDKQFELQNVNQALTLMKQRTADLRAAESVALQSIPTFKVQEFTNANLARKVNSAFIITVPAFKTALVSSVIAKQQSIQAQGLSALQEATSELLKKNADNVVKQMQMSQQLANSSAINVEAIEYSWNTIINGIQQYKEMEKSYDQIRKDESERIKAANNRYLTEVSKGNAI